MNHQDRLEELDARIRRIRLAAPDANLIELLRAELQKSQSEEETLYLYSLLAKELQAHGRYREAESAIRASIQVQPRIADSWITLALHHLYYTRQLEEALSATNEATEKARLEGNFVRQAHIERIRIALELKDYSIVEESLEVLLQHEPPKGSLDVQLEGEFLSRIPPDAVDATVVEKYKHRLHRVE